MRNSVLLSIFISLLVHVALWGGLSIAPSPRDSKKDTKVEVVILDQSPAHKKIAEDIKQQIVEQNDKPLNDEVPESANFLSAHNQRTVHETRALETGSFKNTSSKKTMLGKSTQKNSPKNGKINIASLSPKFDPSEFRETTEPSPNERDESSSSQASQTNDYLKNTTPSLETVLNTREFVYYSYYQRIRAQIRQYWEPSIRQKVQKIFAQGRSIASEHDHITRVIITLDNAGRLLKVQVTNESGLKDLDDAAVEAFRAAEPFPNPPKGIIETDGTIKINWDFILEASINNSQRHALST
jgi:protein TonB